MRDININYNTAQYAENKRENEALVLERKSKPCMDCGLLWHPACMTFDHRGRKGKYRNGNGVVIHPNRMLTYNPYDFKNMLDGCDAVCSNCHKIREMYRDNVLSKGKYRAFYKLIERGGLLKTELASPEPTT